MDRSSSPNTLGASAGVTPTAGLASSPSSGREGRLHQQQQQESAAASITRQLGLSAASSPVHSSSSTATRQDDVRRPPSTASGHIRSAASAANGTDFQVVDFDGRQRRSRRCVVSASHVETMDDARDSRPFHVRTVRGISHRRRHTDGGRVHDGRPDRIRKRVAGNAGNADRRARLPGDDGRHVGAGGRVLAAVEGRVATAPAGDGTACPSPAARTCHGPTQEANTVAPHPAGSRPPTSAACQTASAECHGRQVSVCTLPRPSGGIAPTCLRERSFV
jgi:hypothetical protein